jgi:hypothetical protein
MSLQKSSWLIASANLMVFIHVVGSYQVSMFTRFCYFFIFIFIFDKLRYFFIKIFENVKNIVMIL